MPAATHLTATSTMSVMGRTPAPSAAAAGVMDPTTLSSPAAPGTGLAEMAPMVSGLDVPAGVVALTFAGHDDSCVPQRAA